MSADLYFTRVSFFFFFFFLSFFFFRRLISEIAERNSTKIGHMVGSKCNLKTHVRNLGYPSPYKSGPKNHLFWTTLRFNGKFNGLYLGNKTWYRQSVKCVYNYKMSPTSSQNVMNFGQQTASNSTCIFTHPYVNSAFHFIVRLCRRRSANGTQPHFVKRSTVALSNNVP